MNTYGTTIAATYVGRREEDGWPFHLWDVTLTREGTSITLPYRMGVGHEQTKCGKPKPSTTRYAIWPMSVCRHVSCENAGWQPTPPALYDVLTSLKFDALHGETFNEWCAGLGYDTDSRKAMDIYLACQASEEQSRRFFRADWALIIDDEDYS